MSTGYAGQFVCCERDVIGQFNAQMPNYLTQGFRSESLTYSLLQKNMMQFINIYKHLETLQIN